MSFLTPLYLLAGLGIALPIIFHMIRRQPQGKVQFSSLMFLTQSPPRLVRRSKIDDWLLLVLRGLVLALLAWAFARPFLRSYDDASGMAPARSRVIVLDTSASMRREDLWQQAIAQVQKIIRESGPADVLALYTFDSSVNALLPLDSVLQTPPDQRLSQLNSLLPTLRPTWYSTDLGKALTTVADAVSIGDEQADAAAINRIEILLITDLQSGADLRQLERFQWPQNVSVDLRTVSAIGRTNAYFQSVKQQTGDDQENVSKRVQIANEVSSKSDQFSLEWRDASDKSLPPPTSTTVPAGQTKTVRVGANPRGAVQLVLKGDDQAFDNHQFISIPVPKKEQLVLIGDITTSEPTGRPSYFLEKLPFDNDERTVEFVTRSVDDASPLPTRAQAPLIVVTSGGPNDLDGLAQAVALGTHVLWVLDQPLADAADAENVVERLAKLTGDNALKIREAEVKDYAMLSQIDFTHPLFLDLADPKYNDFSKVRFWRHRFVESSEGSAWRKLASFDDGSCALLECTIGRGKVWLFCGGWQPEESQFAMSSKFVPIILGMFELAQLDEPWREAIVCGEEITLPADAQITTIASVDDKTALPTITEGKLQTTVPGLFAFTATDGEGQFAVNLSTKESITTPMDVSRLEQLGVTLSRSQSFEELAKQTRQKHVEELEHSQQLWKWLLLAAVVFILGETLLASRRTRLSPGPS